MRSLFDRRADSGTRLAPNFTPEYRIVSGLRRMTNQQMVPLRGLSVPLTSEIVDKYKWDAFWDAPLDLSARSRAAVAEVAGVARVHPRGAAEGRRPLRHRPLRGWAAAILPQRRVWRTSAGLPRKHEEIRRATATYHASGCEVKSNGGRIEVTFPGVEIGKLFTGQLHHQSSRTAA